MTACDQAGCRDRIGEAARVFGSTPTIYHVGVDAPPSDIGQDFVVLKCEHDELWHVDFRAVTT